MLQHELVRVATTDREPSAKPRSVTLRRGEGSADQEKQQSAQLARELESQEAELRRRDALCKEQLGRLEKQVGPGGQGTCPCDLLRVEASREVASCGC